MNLVDLLPYRLQSAPVVDFENAIQPAMDKLEAAFWTMADNIIVDTATDWLPLWEWAYGLTGTGTIEGRRAAVKAKMRGAATTTEELIRSMADAYSEEPAELVVDNPAYTFYLYLYSSVGNEPEDLDNLRRVIEEIKPTHLAFEIYLQVEAGGMTNYYGGVVQTADDYNF